MILLYNRGFISLIVWCGLSRLLHWCFHRFGLHMDLNSSPLINYHLNAIQDLMIKMVENNFEMLENNARIIHQGAKLLSSTAKLEKSLAACSNVLTDAQSAVPVFTSAIESASSDEDNMFDETSQQTNHKPDVVEFAKSDATGILAIAAKDTIQSEVIASEEEYPRSYASQMFDKMPVIEIDLEVEDSESDSSNMTTQVLKKMFPTLSALTSESSDVVIFVNQHDQFINDILKLHPHNASSPRDFFGSRALVAYERFWWLHNDFGFHNCHWFDTGQTIHLVGGTKSRHHTRLMHEVQVLPETYHRAKLGELSPLASMESSRVSDKIVEPKYSHYKFWRDKSGAMILESTSAITSGLDMKASTKASSHNLLLLSMLANPLALTSMPSSRSHNLLLERGIFDYFCALGLANITLTLPRVSLTYFKLDFPLDPGVSRNCVQGVGPVLEKDLVYASEFLGSTDLILGDYGLLFVITIGEETLGFVIGFIETLQLQMGSTFLTSINLVMFDNRKELQLFVAFPLWYFYQKDYALHTTLHGSVIKLLEITCPMTIIDFLFYPGSRLRSSYWSSVIGYVVAAELFKSVEGTPAHFCELRLLVGELIVDFSMATFDCLQYAADATRNTCALVRAQLVLWYMSESLLFHLSRGSVDIAPIGPLFDKIPTNPYARIDYTCIVFDPGGSAFGVFVFCYWEPSGSNFSLLFVEAPTQSLYCNATGAFEWFYLWPEFCGATLGLVYNNRKCLFVIPIDEFKFGAAGLLLILESSREEFVKVTLPDFLNLTDKVMLSLIILHGKPLPLWSFVKCKKVREVSNFALLCAIQWYFHTHALGLSRDNLVKVAKILNMAENKSLANIGIFTMAIEDTIAADNVLKALDLWKEPASDALSATLHLYALYVVVVDELLPKSGSCNFKVVAALHSCVFFLARKSVFVLDDNVLGTGAILSPKARYYDPNGGLVFLDTVDMHTLQPYWLLDQLGMVNQEPALFAISIPQIRLDKKTDATMGKVLATAYAANVLGKNLFVFGCFNDDHINDAANVLASATASTLGHIFFFSYKEHFGIAKIGVQRATNRALDANLEDKVLIEAGSNVMNENILFEGALGILAIYVWDPG